MAQPVWEEVRGNALWDGIKEGAKLMLPFLAGLGIRQWFTEHAVALMWIVALVVSAAVAFWDQWRIPKRGPRAQTAIAESRLKIHSAWYGVGNSNDVDVTEFLNRLPRESISVEVGNGLIPGIADPAHGKRKRLEVNYSYGYDKNKTCSRWEYEQLILPEDKGLKERTAAEYDKKRKDDLAAQELKHAAELSQFKSDIHIRTVTRYMEHSSDPGAKHDPLKVMLEMRNESACVVDIKVLEFEAGLLQPKRFLAQVLQIRMLGEWCPVPHEAERVAVLPDQVFRAWVSFDESKHTKEELERLNGRIGTLILLANSQKVRVDL